MAEKLLAQDKIKKVELDILVSFHLFCKQNRLVYTLAYGTLIGAVRHKGFIPWDDDIDVVMPRQDYDKFIQLALDGVYPEGCKVQSTETDGFIQSFAKVINPSVRIESGRNLATVKEWLWIDVFPVDGLPDSSPVRTLMYSQAKILSTLSVVDQLDPNYKSSPLMRAAITVFGPIARHSSLPMWASRMLKNLSKRFEFGSTSLSGVVGWGFGENEAFPSSYYTDRILMPFEGHLFYAPAHYDEMLSMQYGDYMQLPPESQRVTHELTAYQLVSD